MIVTIVPSERRTFSTIVPSGRAIVSMTTSPGCRTGLPGTFGSPGCGTVPSDGVFGADGRVGEPGMAGSDVGGGVTGAGFTPDVPTACEALYSGLPPADTGIADTGVVDDGMVNSGSVTGVGMVMSGSGGSAADAVSR